MPWIDWLRMEFKELEPLKDICPFCIIIIRISVQLIPISSLQCAACLTHSVDLHSNVPLFVGRLHSACFTACLSSRRVQEIRNTQDRYPFRSLFSRSTCLAISETSRKRPPKSDIVAYARFHCTSYIISHKMGQVKFTAVSWSVHV